MPSTILSDNGVSSGSAGLKTTAASDGALALQTTTAGGTATTAVTIDTSQRVGVGVTPSAWVSGDTVLQVKAGSGSGALWGRNNSLRIVGNTFFDGTNYKYIASDYASFMVCNPGTVGGFNWNIAASGTAGANATFTQAMTLDASGNLGIGTTSPAAKIEVSGSGNNILSVTSSSNGEGTLYLGCQGTGTKGNIVGRDYLTFHTTSSSTPVATGTERARINSSGYFKASADGTYIGSTGAYHELRGGGTDGYTVIVSSPLASPGAQYMFDLRFSAATPNNSSARFWSTTDASAVRGYFKSDGGLANYSANNVNLSDEREKKDVELAGNYLDKICAIPVKTFLYNDQTDEYKNLGVMAQDVQAIAPELVSESNWGSEEEPKMRLSIYQTDLQYALMKSIQELKAIVDAQAAEIAALKGN